MNDRVVRQLTLENRLRIAVAEQQFLLHYQPKFDARTRRICGLEALIRWQSPESGMIPPSQFIPMLEDTGLILDVGRWVVGQAVADHLHLRRKGLEPPRMAINVSALQLNDNDYVADLARLVDGAGAARNLDLEITESAVMGNIGRATATLDAVRAMGLRIAIDDFGTGYSSLSYLARLPIDYLKIDRSFIADVCCGLQNREIVAAVISLAHSLKLKVVAEGVETAEQADLLRRLECDEMQGYLLSAPVPLARIETMLRDVASKPALVLGAHCA
jgi:EAL domain-containing protein (putative c-di-GMP-specific phosphodiesterase class I)